MYPMHDYAKKLLSLPDAPDQVNALQAVLNEERRRRQEFREWVTEEVKAEFINGEIVARSPVKKRHWDALDLLSRLMSVYASSRKLGRVATEKAMISLTRNDYEPDICFFSAEKVAAFEEDQLFFPAPDLIVEILSPKTERLDRGIKKDDYAAHGVREYWIVDPLRQRVEQFFLLSPEDKVYFQPYVFVVGEDMESRVIPGFHIPVRAIFDEAANLEAMKTLV